MNSNDRNRIADGITVFLITAALAILFFLVKHAVQIHAKWGFFEKTLLMLDCGVAIGLLIAITAGGEAGALIGFGSVVGWLVGLTVADAVLEQNLRRDYDEFNIDDVAPRSWW